MQSKISAALLKCVFCVGAAFLLAPFVVLCGYVLSDMAEAASINIFWKNLEIHKALRLSFKVAVVSVIIGFVLGTLLATGLAKAPFWGGRWIAFLTLFTVALPAVVFGMSLQALLNIKIIKTGFVAAVLTHSTFCMLIFYICVRNKFRRDFKGLIDASMDLGANGFQAIWYTVLPALSRYLLIATLFSVIVSLNEVAVTAFLMGSDQTLSVWLLRNIHRPEQSQNVLTVALVLMLITVGLIIFSAWLLRGRRDIV